MKPSLQGKYVICPPLDFEDAIERAQLPLFGYLVRLTGSVNDAQDLLQMTNVTAWTRKDSFETGSNLIAWMRAIAINHARNEFRRRDRRATVPLLDAELSEIAEARHAMRRREAPDRDCLVARQAQVDRCKEKLSDRQRILVDEFYHQGLTLQQIAERDGSNANAIGQRLHRVRSTLIQCVQLAQTRAEQNHTSLIP